MIFLSQNSVLVLAESAVGAHYLSNIQPGKSSNKPNSKPVAEITTGKRTKLTGNLL